MCAHSHNAFLFDAASLDSKGRSEIPPKTLLSINVRWQSQNDHRSVFRTTVTGYLSPRQVAGCNIWQQVMKLMFLQEEAQFSQRQFLNRRRLLEIVTVLFHHDKNLSAYTLLALMHQVFFPFFSRSQQNGDSNERKAIWLCTGISEEAMEYSL